MFSAFNMSCKLNYQKSIKQFTVKNPENTYYDSQILKKFCSILVLLFDCTLTTFFNIKIKKKSQNGKNLRFSNNFWFKIEWSGSGSRRQKNFWIRWIRITIRNRIRNTGPNYTYYTIKFWFEAKKCVKIQICKCRRGSETKFSDPVYDPCSD